MSAVGIFIKLVQKVAYCYIFVPCFGIMAPKGEPKSKSRAKGKAAVEESEVSMPSEDKKRMQSNFSTQMKQSELPEHKEALELYKSLGHAHPLKDQILLN